LGGFVDTLKSMAARNPVPHTREQLVAMGDRLKQQAAQLDLISGAMEVAGVAELSIVNAIEAQKGLNKIGSFCEAAARALMEHRMKRADSEQE
jgi:hypothetical protein